MEKILDALRRKSEEHFLRLSLEDKYLQFLFLWFLLGPWNSKAEFSSHIDEVFNRYVNGRSDGNREHICSGIADLIIDSEGLIFDILDAKAQCVRTSLYYLLSSNLKEFIQTLKKVPRSIAFEFIMENFSALLKTLRQLLRPKNGVIYGKSTIIFRELASVVINILRPNKGAYERFVEHLKRILMAYLNMIVRSIMDGYIKSCQDALNLFRFVLEPSEFWELTWSLFIDVLRRNYASLKTFIGSCLGELETIISFLRLCPVGLKRQFLGIFPNSHIVSVFRKTTHEEFLKKILMKIGLTFEDACILFVEYVGYTKKILKNFILEALKKPFETLSIYINDCILCRGYAGVIETKGTFPLECFERIFLWDIEAENVPWVLKLLFEIDSSLTSVILKPENFFKLSFYYLKWCDVRVIKETLWPYIIKMLKSLHRGLDREAVEGLLRFLLRIPTELFDEMILDSEIVANIGVVIKDYLIDLHKIFSKDFEVPSITSNFAQRVLYKCRLLEILYRNYQLDVENMLLQKIREYNCEAFWCAIELAKKHNEFHSILRNFLISFIKNDLDAMMFIGILDRPFKDGGGNFDLFRSFLEYSPEVVLKLKHKLSIVESKLAGHIEGYSLLVISLLMRQGEEFRVLIENIVRNKCLLAKTFRLIDELLEDNSICSNQEYMESLLIMLLKVLTSITPELILAPHKDSQGVCADNLLELFTETLGRVAYRILHYKQILPKDIRNALSSVLGKLIEEMSTQTFIRFLLLFLDRRCNYIHPIIAFSLLSLRVREKVIFKLCSISPEELIGLIEYVWGLDGDYPYWLILIVTHISPESTYKSIIGAQFNQLLQLLNIINWPKCMGEKIVDILRDVLEYRIVMAPPDILLKIIRALRLEVFPLLIDAIDRSLENFDEKIPTTILKRMFEHIYWIYARNIFNRKGFQNSIEIFLRKGDIPTLASILSMYAEKEEAFKELADIIVQKILKFKNYSTMLYSLIAMTYRKSVRKNARKKNIIIDTFYSIFSKKYDLFPMIPRFLRSIKQIEQQYTKRKIILRNIEWYKNRSFWDGIALLLRSNICKEYLVEILNVLGAYRAYQKIATILDDLKYDFQALSKAPVVLCKTLLDCVHSYYQNRPLTFRITVSGIYVLAMVVHALSSKNIKFETKEFITNINVLRSALVTYLSYDEIHNKSFYKAYIWLTLELLRSCKKYNVELSDFELNILRIASQDTSSVTLTTKILEILCYVVESKRKIKLRQILEIVENINQKFPNSTNWVFLKTKYRLLSYVAEKYSAKKWLLSELEFILSHANYNKKQRGWVSALAELIRLAGKLYERRMIGVKSIGELLEKIHTLEWVGQIIKREKNWNIIMVKTIPTNFLEEIHVSVLDLLKQLAENKEKNINYSTFLQKVMEPKIVPRAEILIELLDVPLTVEKIVEYENVYRSLYDRIIDIISVGLKNGVLSPQIMTMMIDKLLKGCIQEALKIEKKFGLEVEQLKDSVFHRTLELLGKLLKSIPSPTQIKQLEKTIEAIFEKYERSFKRSTKVPKKTTQVHGEGSSLTCTSILEKIHFIKMATRRIIEEISKGRAPPIEELKEMLTDMNIYKYMLKQAIEQNDRVIVSLEADMRYDYEEEWEEIDFQVDTGIHICSSTEKLYERTISRIHVGRIADSITWVDRAEREREEMIRELADNYLKATLDIIKELLGEATKILERNIRKLDPQITLHIEKQTYKEKPERNPYGIDGERVTLTEYTTIEIVARKNAEEKMRIPVVEISKTIEWIYCDATPAFFPSNYCIRITILCSNIRSPPIQYK